MLYTPKADIVKGIVVQLHGGPSQRAQEMRGGSGLLKKYVDQGYALIELNYRGTIGLGRTATAAGYAGKQFENINLDIAAIIKAAEKN